DKHRRARPALGNAEKSDRAGGDALNRLVTGIGFLDAYTRRKVFRHDTVLVWLRQGEIGHDGRLAHKLDVELCACIVSGHATSATGRSLMNARRCIGWARKARIGI